MHDEDIEPFDDLLLQRGGGGESRVADGRPEIGEQREVLAQPEQPCLGPHLVRYLVPFRPADRTEQNGVRGERLGHVLFGDRLAVGVVGAAADQPLLGLEAGAELRVHESDQLLHLGHRLHADAVAGKEEELFGCHGDAFGEEFLPRAC
jgi:hypothetical protein